MYEEFYLLSKKPFDLLPDANFLYMSSGHDSAYTHLKYAVRENKGFVVITGEIGSGKTTLINYLLRQLPEDLQVAVISHTDVEPELFFKLINRKFNLPYQGLDKGEMLIAFQDFILATRRENRRVVLIIDEAQNLPDNTIEEIRMLSNLEAEQELLIQIILVGQPELRQKLRQPKLRQFLQRVTVHYHLQHLNEEEVREYIRHRLHVAGCPNYATLFTEEATSRIWEASRGVPRMINYICDLALVHGYADGKTVIDLQIIEAVINSRNQSGLFGELREEIGSEIGDLQTDPPLSAPISGEILNSLEQRLAAIEHQLQELGRKSDKQAEIFKNRDLLTIELFNLLKQSLKDRQKIALHFQKLYTRYQKLYETLQTHRTDNRQGK
ncbi:MAG: AAA family ATPase [Deltaproteobacteria bacterium]|nr:AAA family ATPase [Deltaproteobacteria bacterium]